MKTQCGHCECTVRDGAALCQRCTRVLAVRLQSVPGLLADLIVMRSGEARLAPETPRIHMTATPRIPAQITPVHGTPTMRGDRELTALTEAVMITAAQLAETLGVPGPPESPGLAQLAINNRLRNPRRHQYDPALLDPASATPMEMAAIWCACHPADLRAHPEAGTAHRRMSSAVRALHAAIDPERRRYLGPCPTELDDDTTCGAKLLAAPGRTTVRCTRCRMRYVVADLETAALVRAEDAKWTARELLEYVLPSIGVHIARRTLYRWAHRHTIPPRGYQSADGRITDRRIAPTDPEVYRLGDVLAAAARDVGARRKATP